MTHQTPPLDYLIRLIFKIVIALFVVGLLFAALSFLVIMLLAVIGLRFM